nr:ribonuclease H-like domain-containing protein [Tanacetum cinerariifolium]
MTDLGSLIYFLGSFVKRDSSRMFLSQRKYAVEILERAHMVNCNPSQTLVDIESKLGDNGDPVSTLYRNLTGSFVKRDSSRMFLSQRKYVVEILERAHMVNCNPSQTLVDIESKLGDNGDPVSTLYRNLAGSLNIVRCMWSLHHKYLANGTVSRYKAPPVANGSTHVTGIDVDKT